MNRKHLIVRRWATHTEIILPDGSIDRYRKKWEEDDAHVAEVLGDFDYQPLPSVAIYEPRNRKHKQK